MSTNRRRAFERIREGLLAGPAASDPSIAISKRVMSFYFDDDTVGEATVAASRDGVYLLAVIEDLGDRDRDLATRVWESHAPELWFVDLRAQLIRQRRAGQPERVFAGVDSIAPAFAPGASFTIAELFA
jgi:hypothetical protein